jgi:hypothetical protein
MTANEDDVIAQLLAIEPTLGPDAPKEQWTTDAGDLMESIPPSPEWLGRLVEAFGATQNPDVANSLAFVLTNAANDRDRARWVAPLAVQAIQALRIDSPWPRFNLCSALDRLIMFDALGPELGRPIPGLGRLLIDAMKGPDLVQAIAALVVYQLRLHLPGVLTDADRDAAEAAVVACAGSPNAELARHARAVTELRSRAAR